MTGPNQTFIIELKKIEALVIAQAVHLLLESIKKPEDRAYLEDALKVLVDQVDTSLKFPDRCQTYLNDPPVISQPTKTVFFTPYGKKK